jgi:Haem-degrading
MVSPCGHGKPSAHSANRKKVEAIVDLHLQLCFLERIVMVTLQEARKIIAAAEIKAIEINQPVNIAVVDEGGRLR